MASFTSIGFIGFSFSESMLSLRNRFGFSVLWFLVYVGFVYRVLSWLKLGHFLFFYIFHISGEATLRLYASGVSHGTLPSKVEKKILIENQNFLLGR